MALGISKALVITEDRAYEKNMLSFYAKKSTEYVGVAELNWYDVLKNKSIFGIFFSCA